MKDLKKDIRKGLRSDRDSLCTHMATARKPRPRLPLSVFTSTNTTYVDFPLPSPDNVHPTTIIDANVIAVNGDPTLTQWKKEAGQVLASRLGGVVLSLPGANLEEAIDW
jgi:hypothetical protein